MQQKNLVLFIILSFLILMGGKFLQDRFWPPPQPKSEQAAPGKAIELPVRAACLAGASTPAGTGLNDAFGAAANTLALLPKPPSPVQTPQMGAACVPGLAAPSGTALGDALRGMAGMFALAPRVRARSEVKAIEPPPGPIELGDSGGEESRFNLFVLLDPRGGAIRSITLNKFQQADQSGLPVVYPDKTKAPLDLVPGYGYAGEPSYILYHFPDPEHPDRPVETLGRRVWQVVPEESKTTGDERQVVFQTDFDDFRITKRYTLSPGDYHVGLVVKIELKKSALVAQKFRYQFTSGHNLPVEGDWYTSTFRNGVVGQVDKADQPENENTWRTFEALQQISHRGGGDEVLKGDRPIIYAGVAVQYFASLLVVDDQQTNRSFLARARATVESAAIRGKIEKIDIDRKTFTLVADDGSHPTFFDAQGKALFLPERLPVTVVYSSNGYDQLVAQEVLPAPENNKRIIDDITVRVATEAIDLKPGEAVEHKYLLYNGPVKVMLLGQLEGDKKVDPELVNRYIDRLHLNTLTDYHSPGWIGENVTSRIGWTFLLIKCTNLMHRILWALHEYILPWAWSYGLCILMLTILVRGAMFPVSRKQAMTSIRMQALAPELKKLQEKHKDDRQALGMAQMELYRRHGLNPMGSCWLILLQMPIFLGLYYALQESIHFRLAPFLWIQNLAAPDMLVHWGESIPWISRPENYGSFLYLGPYFNLLPVIAVGLMIAQQSLMTPPAMDEQQAMQQKMMKYMMIFFGLMFYKVAAGLCLYFIASSLWGFAERKLLPKRKLGVEVAAAPAARPGLFHKLLGRLHGLSQAAQAANAGTTANQAAMPAGPATFAELRRRSRQARNRRRQARDRRREDGAPGPGAARAANPTSPGDGAMEKVRTWWSGVRDWWSEVLKKAEKR